MRNTLLASLCFLLLLPVSASALEVDENLVAVAAMPLAVAAVADLAEVPQNDLIEVIRTMNAALVPAPQFIEVVRYIPIALLDAEQPFTTYVETQYERGLTGPALAVAMEDRIETYHGADIDVERAPSVVVVDDDFYPEVVVTRFQPVRYDPVSLVAMPLAVAAVAELTDIPPAELASFVSLLNQARVPPAQFVEVVRYSPVALVDTDPAFLTFVTTQVSDGTRGMLLARALADRYEDVYDVQQINVVEPPRIVYTDPQAFVPPVVVRQVAEGRAHPHGGPPGQLKKRLGLQTGAEVVHGTRPGSAAPEPRVARERAPKKARQTVKATREHRGSKQRPAPRVTTRGERPKPARVAPSPSPSRGGGKAPHVDKPKRGGGAQNDGNHAGGGGAANAGGNKGQGKGKGKG